MIDTIVLSLNKDQFEITDPDKFSPSAKIMETPSIQIGQSGVIKCFQNPSKQDLRNGIYKPRLTLIKRLTKGGYSQTLRVEFSVPKLLFGNNFEEISPSDWPRASRLFVAKPLEMGCLFLVILEKNSPCLLCTILRILRSQITRQVQ